MRVDFLANSANVISSLPPKKGLTLFLEHDEHLLLLMRSHKENRSGTWEIPRVKLKSNQAESHTQLLLRKLQKKMQIQLFPNQIQYRGRHHGRFGIEDDETHLYYANLKGRPTVQFAGKKYCQYEWVSIYAFKTIPFSKRHDEAFDILYGDRIWQLIDPNTSSIAQKTQNTSLILRKGRKTLLFNQERRVVFNLLGMPGSGKGTQAQLLSRLFGIPHVSNGDCIRNEIKANSLLGKMIKQFEKDCYPAPLPLPDAIHIGIMMSRLSANDCQKGFILDGFPRTKHQGDVTRELILRKNDFHIPLFIDIPEGDVWERLHCRSICPKCGHQGKFDENPTSGLCPKDGQPLERRTDDIDTIKIKRRLEIFAINNEETLDSMNKRDQVANLKLTNAIPPREVLHLICSIVQRRLDQLARSEEEQMVQEILPFHRHYLTNNKVLGLIPIATKIGECKARLFCKDMSRYFRGEGEWEQLLS